MANEDILRGLSKEFYEPSLSRAMFSDKEAKKEYTRLRRAANRRIESLQKSGYESSAIMRRYGKGFESSRGLSPEAIREKLGEAAAFLSRKTSTVRGQKAALSSFVETMREKGYDFINKKNAAQFGRFMEAAKKHYGNIKAYSEQILEMFEDLVEEREDIDAISRNFDDWLEAQTAEEIPEPVTVEQMEPSGKRQSGKKSGQMSASQREKRAQKARSERRTRASQKRGATRRR